MWVDPRRRTPVSPLSGKVVGGALGPASWLARLKTPAVSEAEVRAELERSMKDWAVAGVAPADSKRAEDVVTGSVGKFLPAGGKIEPQQVLHAVRNVKEALVMPLVDRMIEGSLLEASVGVDREIIIDVDLIEQLRPLIWQQVDPRLTADTTQLREEEGAVTAPPLGSQYMQALLADLLPAPSIGLCEPYDYHRLEAAYKDYHTEVCALVKAEKDVSRISIRRYVLEKLRLSQAGAIRDALLAAIDPGDPALSQLWREAFEAAERHIKGLRVGELAAFQLRDFVVERVSVPEQPQAQAQLPASSSTTTTSPSADGD